MRGESTGNVSVGRLSRALAAGGAFSLSFVLGGLVWLVLPFVKVGELGSFSHLGWTVGAAGAIAGLVLGIVSHSRRRLRFAIAGVVSFGLSLGILAAGLVFVLFFFATFFGFVGVPPGMPSRLRAPVVVGLMSPLVWASVIGVVTGASIGGWIALITRRGSVVQSAIAGGLGFWAGVVLGLGAAAGFRRLFAPGCRRLDTCPTAYGLMLLIFGLCAFFCGGVSLGWLYAAPESDQGSASTAT